MRGPVRWSRIVEGGRIFGGDGLGLALKGPIQKQHNHGFGDASNSDNLE